MVMETPDTASMSLPGSRVLHFLSWGARSGAERMTLNLCKATRGLEPAVWFPRPGPVVREFRDAGIPILDTLSVLADPELTRRRFSLLHIHCGTHEPEAHRAARRLGIPSIVTLHTHLALPEIDCPLVCVAPHTAAIQDCLNRVSVIPNAIDCAQFSPAPRPAKDRIVIMRVCRPDRCAPWFLDAMRSVLARHANAELWIVGEDGPSGGRVRYFGPRSDVAELLRQADLFAYAPFPGSGSHDLCVLEAMATGLPVVVTDVPAVRPSVRDSDAGLLVPFGDREAFAAAVERLVRDSALRARLGRNARAAAETHFSLDRLAADYLRAYRDALEAPPPQPSDIIRRRVREAVARRLRIASLERALCLLNDTLAGSPLANRYWIVGGLLIGWAREGGILPHDCQDADFGLFEEDRDRFLATIPLLVAAGFAPMARYVDNRGIAVEYSFLKEGLRFDFFFHEPVGSLLRSTFFGISASPHDPRPIELICEVPRYALAPFQFLGRVWLKPDDHDSFLTAEYGNWRVPDPAFDHRTGDRSVVLINWWNNAAPTRFHGAPER